MPRYSLAGTRARVLASRIVERSIKERHPHGRRLRGVSPVPEIELSAGTVEYRDTGGPGPVLVFLHGVLMNGSAWRHVVAALGPDFRCVAPTLPLGAHRHPMRPEA